MEHHEVCEQRPVSYIFGKYPFEGQHFGDDFGRANVADGSTEADCVADLDGRNQSS